MSIPKNHHYVSQCQLREFYNEGERRIYLYDKQLRNHYSKPGLKKIFSEDFLNSRQTNAGMDHEQLEFELKILVEDNYPHHLDIVKKFVQDQQNMAEVYEALGWLTMIGLIGEFRHPEFKSTFDQFSDYVESDMLSKITGKSREELIELVENKKKTKYANVIGYLSIALRIFEKMEPMVYSIMSIKSSDCFILPDTSCFQIRGQLRQYPSNLINEIVQVGVPLTPKLFFLATPQHLANESGILTINDDNSEKVFEINRDLYDFAYKTVACSDDLYLKNFINKRLNKQ